MSHNLNYNEQKKTYSFVGVKTPAWHGLGTILPERFTEEEAIRYANLDYNVAFQKLMTEDGRYINTHFATTRADNDEILGVVGKDYRVVQNKDLFSFFSQVVGEGKAIFETAGCLGKGERVFITAKLPETVTVHGDISPIENYLVLASSHDASLAITVYFTPIRVVCQNTLMASLHGTPNKVYVKHTENVKERFLYAAKIIGLASAHMLKTEQAFNMMMDKAIPDSEAKRLFFRAFLNPTELRTLALNGNVELSTRKSNMIEAVNEYYLSAEDINPIRGNAYGVLNGMTSFFQNVREFSDRRKKFESIVLEGNAFQYTQKLFDSLVKY